jgi:hypothetical protein
MTTGSGRTARSITGANLVPGTATTAVVSGLASIDVLAGGSAHADDHCSVTPHRHLLLSTLLHFCSSIYPGAPSVGVFSCPRPPSCWDRCSRSRITRAAHGCGACRVSQSASVRPTRSARLAGRSRCHTGTAPRARQACGRPAGVGRGQLRVGVSHEVAVAPRGRSEVVVEVMTRP